MPGLELRGICCKVYIVNWFQLDIVCLCGYSYVLAYLFIVLSEFIYLQLVTSIYLLQMTT